MDGRRGQDDEMNRPHVTIVTPTRPGRETELYERCMQSIADQRYDGSIDHIIVSDRNPKVHQIAESARLDFESHSRDPYHAQVVEINNTWANMTTIKSVGAIPWYIGSMLAHGVYVGFLGDDDEYLPHHVETHVSTMERTEADFSVSATRFFVRGEPKQVIGGDQFAHGHLDATGIMCRREALRTANWTANGEDAADWRLVRDWLAGGLKGELIPEVTSNHHDGWMLAWFLKEGWIT
jgi:hypothetical protein